MILSFDTETTGLVRNELPADHPSQPRLVQLAALLLEDDGTERSHIALLVKPGGFEVPVGAASVHGITTELATRGGVPLLVALAAFSQLAKNATHHVGHNVTFDVTVLTAEFARINRPLPPLDAVCTKELAAPIVNLPPTERMLRAGFTKPKPPTLTECIRFFFDEDLTDAHDALVDARACARVYFELLRRDRERQAGGSP